MVEKPLKDTSCCLPWNHLATHPSGHVTLCCQAKMSDGSGFAWNEKNRFLSLDNVKINDVLNSQNFIRVREEMLAGKEPEACKRCYEAERAGEWNKREYENTRFEWSSAGKTSTVKTDDLEFLELRIGNVCNLACVTCNSVSSSRWRADELAIAEQLPWYKKLIPVSATRSHWFEDEQFYADLAKNSTNVKTIYINGGEPFLIHAHKRLLVDLINSGVAKNIVIEYSTNVTVKPVEYLELWKHFKQVNIMLSIDDLGERNDWLRWPSNWKQVQENIFWYQDNKLDNMNLIVCQTISAINIHFVSEFIDYCKKLNLNHTANFVFDPIWLSARTIKPNVKAQISKQLSSYKLHQLESWLQLGYSEQSEVQQFEYIQQLCKTRSQDFNKIKDLFEQ